MAILFSANLNWLIFMKQKYCDQKRGVLQNLVNDLYNTVSGHSVKVIDWFFVSSGVFFEVGK